MIHIANIRANVKTLLKIFCDTFLIDILQNRKIFVIIILKMTFQEIHLLGICSRFKATIVRNIFSLLFLWMRIIQSSFTRVKSYKNLHSFAVRINLSRSKLLSVENIKQRIENVCNIKVFIIS